MVNLIRGMALAGTVLGSVALLAGCQKEEILQGTRIDPRDVIEGASVPGPENVARPISLPKPQANADWPQRAGDAQHLLVNPALGAGVTQVWEAPIGQGDSYRYRLVAEPVVAAGQVFTLDSRGLVTATAAANGARIWQASITPAGDRADDATGSGLAYDGGRLYVTSTYGELVALDARTGAVIWRQRFDAGIGGAPTVADGVVYVVARDASAWAIQTSDGKVLWQLDAAPAPAGMGGASAPVVAGRAVIFPFATGEMLAAMRQGGIGLWQANVAGRRVGRGYSQVQDLTGEPVVAGNVVYAGSSAGKLSAFDLDSGTMLWTAQSGPTSPVQVAGGALFMTTDDAKLQRLDAATGRVIWSVDLPQYVREKIKKQNEIWVNYGPVLAGGRLFVPSSDGVLRVFDPVNGALVSQGVIPSGASTDPVVAGGTLYLVGRDGVLRAYR